MWMWVFVTIEWNLYFVTTIHTLHSHCNKSSKHETRKHSKRMNAVLTTFNWFFATIQTDTKRTYKHTIYLLAWRNERKATKQHRKLCISSSAVVNATANSTNTLPPYTNAILFSLIFGNRFAMLDPWRISVYKMSSTTSENRRHMRRLWKWYLLKYGVLLTRNFSIVWFAHLLCIFQQWMTLENLIFIKRSSVFGGVLIKCRLRIER